MKRTLSMILLMVLAFATTLSMVRVTNAVTIVTVGFDPLKVPGRVGKNIAFDITISGIDSSVLDLWAWELKLNWTDTDFNYVSAVEGPFLEQSGSTFWVSPIKGGTGGNETLTLSCTRTGAGSGSLGSGVLATVTLFVVGGTTGSKFDLYGIKLRNSMLNPIQPPEANIIDQTGEFALARSYDIEPTFGEVDIYDLATVGVNYGTNVNKPKKSATAWTGTWSNPEFLGASDDLRASSGTQNAAETLKNFAFNITGWTGVTTVEVGLERKIDSGTRSIQIQVSTDNGATWKTQSYTDNVADLADTMIWIPVTNATTWTAALVSSIAIRMTLLGTGTVAVRVDYLVVRVTPTPTYGGIEAFNPDADVTGDRQINIDDLVLVATKYGTYEL